MYVAGKLLDKAQSTPYDAEALSLVRRSCLILMRLVTDSDEEAGSGGHGGPGDGPGRDGERAVTEWQPVPDRGPATARHLDVNA